MNEASMLNGEMESNLRESSLPSTECPQILQNDTLNALQFQIQS